MINWFIIHIKEQSDWTRCALWKKMYGQRPICMRSDELCEIEREISRRKNGIWKAWESINANYSCIYLYISTQSELYGKDGIYSIAVFSIWLIFYGEKQNDEREKYTNKWNYIHRERIFLATLLITFLRSNRIVPMRTSNSPTRTTNVWCVN